MLLLQVFIFMTGVFVSSWIGGALLSVGEWIIKKLPLIKHIYSAAKQVTAGLNPENENAKSFRECVIIRHPRHGEYAIAFITGETVFQVCRSTTFCLPVQNAFEVDDCKCESSSADHRLDVVLQTPKGEMKLYSVYVPTNHV